MYNIIKSYNCFGKLSKENNSLCPDKSIYCFSQKSGKSKVMIKIFDGPCEKPMIVKRFGSVEEMESYVEDYIKDFEEVKTINF